MIDVLFAEKDGVYSRIKSCNIWDIEKNALNYKGSNPVICHPPCQLWGRFAKINYKRWGGDHNKPKNDGGCFEFALNMVRKNGGVLEHPAYTYAWKEYDLIKPILGGWLYCGNDEYVCEVYQSSYGHLAAKKTWLFYKGKMPHNLNFTKIKGTHQIGFRDQRGKEKNKPTLSGKKASATPIKFANELIKLAKKSNLK
jgi:hypothetical protein